MTRLLQLLPRDAETTAEDVIAAAHVITAEPMAPASDAAKVYCAGLSRRLLNDPDARGYPELQALGFWLRPASTESMIQKHLAAAGQPRRSAAGIVFQLPPRNVATLFGYTSAISLLCGNATMIRLPSAPHPVQILLTRLIKETLAQSIPAIRDRLIILRYEHDDTITGQLSLASDVRLVWGSDETVEHIAGLPLPAHSRHVSFGDRFSAAALKAESYAALDEAGRIDLVKKLFSDIYLFDQMACASPRLLMWIGSDHTTAHASNDFYPRLAAYAVSRGYHIDAGASLAKLNASYLALYDLSPIAYRVYAPCLSVITLPGLARLPAFKSVNYGYGLLLAVRLNELKELGDYVERRDQTLSCWGLDKAETKAFSEARKTPGFDRIVPAGQALTFDPVWDGCNLFDAITRPGEDKA